MQDSRPGNSAQTAPAASRRSSIPLSMSYEPPSEQIEAFYSQIFDVGCC